MNRILVTGNAGSGKSTLARQIGEELEFSVSGLDNIVWRPNWQPTPRAERECLERELAAEPSWVVDGVSFLIQERADVVVFLDIPRWLSFWRCAQRNAFYLFRSRPGLPQNCPEIKIIPTLVKIIWKFPYMVKPKILALGQKHAHRQKFVHVKSKEQVNDFLCSLRQKT